MMILGYKENSSCLINMAKKLI